ncbi:glycosyl transferase family 2 [Streptococcus mitis]|uniref:Glycosyl transferase family protein n=1 Tax=Streptococcus mitis TaxID=28037 RepID=A0AAX2L6R1_STRMT|nr:glycosyltransferase [Streptococcus mitis]MBZ2102978.1 glycosyltransferase [Streptococcus mitis]OOS17266.1 glycosyl transferase family 2 [Streptococcus mitis]QBZ12301.1 glycosyl transferase 2 family protein [Streptococcus mitis NCTC 12261]QGS42812.1 glycosyltransferase [Streptococcus mitis]QXA55456.1 glycosyltransferase [Streptococcus mitis]
MKYSVVIPVYNVEKYIDRCLQSVIFQNYEDLEIIVIENGSTDNSPHICDTYANKYPNISVYHIENHGVGFARNFGLSKARGEFIYFVDADDYLIGNLFSDFEEKLHDKVDLLVFSYYNSIEKDLIELKRNPKILPNNVLLDKTNFITSFKELVLTDMMYTVWNKIYRRDFLIDNNLYFLKYELGEDVRFNLRVYDFVENILLSTECYYVYISGRMNSAMGSYNSNRVTYQLEELSQIEYLLNKWNIFDKSFIDTLKSRILMSNIQNIVLQNMSIETQKKKIGKLCRIDDINSLINSSPSKLHILIRIFLKSKLYIIVIFLKRIQNFVDKKR